MGSCCVYVHGYPQAVHSWTDWHVPIYSGVESGYLPYILALIFILLYCIVLVYVYMHSIPICVFYCLFTIHSIITVMSTPVTTSYLDSLSILYSHSLMKVAVYIVTKRLNYCENMG